MYSEVRRLDALRTVRTAHSGADFESGEVYRRGGLNEEAPGVDAVDGREPEQSTWSDGHINYANESGGWRGHGIARVPSHGLGLRWYTAVVRAPTAGLAGLGTP